MVGRAEWRGIKGDGLPKRARIAMAPAVWA